MKRKSVSKRGGEQFHLEYFCSKCRLCTKTKQEFGNNSTWSLTVVWKCTIYLTLSLVYPLHLMQPALWRGEVLLPCWLPTHSLLTLLHLQRPCILTTYSPHRPFQELVWGGSSFTLSCPKKISTHSCCAWSINYQTTFSLTKKHPSTWSTRM